MTYLFLKYLSVYSIIKIGGLAVLAIGYTSKVDWHVYGNLLIAISAITEGGFLVLMAVTNNIWVNYAAYILYNIVLNVSFTIGWYLYFKTCVMRSTFYVSILICLIWIKVLK